MKISGIFTVSLDFERIWGVHNGNPQGYDAIALISEIYKFSELRTMLEAG